MKRHTLSADRVVDLLRYRRERPQARLDFEGESPRLAQLAPITPFRPLSAREVGHRERMMKHLAASRRS